MSEKYADVATSGEVIEKLKGLSSGEAARKSA
jgi:hypothetical protein